MIYKKHNKTKNFTIIDNNIFENKNLSLQAKGLLCLMLSLSENWDFKKNGLITLSKEINIKTFNKILDELKENKYLKITKTSMDWQWDVFEEPYTIYQNADYRYTKIRGMDTPLYDISQNTNYKVLNNKVLNNNTVNNNKVSKKEAEVMSYNKIIKTYFTDAEMQNVMTEFIKMRKMIKRPITNYGLKLICDKLIKDYKQEEWQAVVQQSIVNNWQNIYPLKKDSQQKEKSQETTQQKNQKKLDAIGEALKEIGEEYELSRDTKYIR